MPKNNDKEQECLLTVETHVLGKGLRQQDVMALLNEVADSPGVTVNVSAGKALIGHVEEHQQVPLLQGAQGSKGEKNERDREKTSLQCDNG